MRDAVDVVLIDTGFDGPARFATTSRSQPHLGLAYMAACLEREGRSVRVIDRIIDPAEPEEIARRLAEWKPRVVGITTSTIDRFMAIRILDEVKKALPDVLTVGGGPHYSVTSGDALTNTPSLDAVVVGEGELTICEVVDRYLATGDPHDLREVDGVVFRDEAGAIVTNRPRLPIKDLDDLPFPAWHLFEMEKYVGTLATAPDLPYRAIGIGSTRGCPYSCGFCSNSLTRKVRYFSVERFVDMIEDVMRKHDIRAFNFVDDSFTCSTRRVMKICAEIKRRGLDIKWYCSLNVNQSAKNVEMLEAMYDAGCIALGFGVEFAHDTVLAAINKKSRTRMIRRALLNVRKVGFPHVYMFLLQGLPGQTGLNTVSAALRTMVYRAILKSDTIYYGGFVQVYPGTDFERQSKENGTLARDFSWNAPYASQEAARYSDTPNQTNKLPTVPVFVPPQMPLGRTLKITKVMGYVEQLCRKPLRFYVDRVVARRSSA